MAFECIGPLLVFAGSGPTLAFIAAGAVFHATIAAFMGLNSFVFAFTAAYPALYVLSAEWQQLLP
jgi:hypothetical protein